jgi:uracil-DNA glycosylase
MQIPKSWRFLGEEANRPYFRELTQFLRSERERYLVFPADENVFAAFSASPYEKVKVVLLGQDPYHGAGQAHGLCFSVKPGVKPPPSLKNIYKELSSDVGLEAPDHGYLMSWAQQGILMLNTVLTVRAGEAGSHRNQGWERFTDKVIRAVNEKTDPVVFVLWGKPAKSKKKLVDDSRHVIVESAHPSPLSARSGFFGSRPFSKINAALRTSGHAEICWQLPIVDHTA